MNINQKYTPKYWVVHDKNSDDIILKTLAKGHDESMEIFLYDLDYWNNEDYKDNPENYPCEIVSINLVDINNND